MFFCKKCGSTLMEDTGLTTLEYSKIVKHTIDEDGELIRENIPKFITFSCRRCGEMLNVDIEAIIDKVRDKAILALLKSRIQVAYKTIDKDKVDEANGISYCGVCPGVIDGSGYCYNDVIVCCKNREVL